MPVLTIASSKGGPGKTTVAMLLAGRLAADGLRVTALDADPTQALSRWAANAYEGPAFTAHAEADETRLAHLNDAESRAADLVLVDTAGFSNLAANVGMTSADAVLIPALSGEADITEAEKACGWLRAGSCGPPRHSRPRAAEPGQADAARPPCRAGGGDRPAADPRDHARRSRGLQRNDVLRSRPGSGHGRRRAQPPGRRARGAG